MADEPVIIRDGNRELTPILSDSITSRNGQTVSTGDRAQVMKLGTGTDGVANDVYDGNPLPIKDLSTSLVPLTGSGVNIVSSASSPIAAANPSRIKIDVTNAGTGRVWLGLGQQATPDNGLYLDPGDVFTEWTSTSVSGIAVADTQRVVFQEWGA